MSKLDWYSEIEKAKSEVTTPEESETYLIDLFITLLKKHQAKKAIKIMHLYLHHNDLTIDYEVLLEKGGVTEKLEGIEPPIPREGEYKPNNLGNLFIITGIIRFLSDGRRGSLPQIINRIRREFVGKEIQ